MPLPKRSIEPVHVARSVYQQEELQNTELETVTNTTLTNIIRQLSSLSKHAEDIFGELARDVGSIGDRANSLQARIDRLAIKVTQLDSNVEEIPLTDIQRKKAFKSAKVFDQQIFSRITMPTPMLETYSQCDKPPPLEKLNIYRDDGKDGLKFYTDPNYFFELWRQEMLKDTERVMHDKGRKMHRPRQEGGSGSSGGGMRGHKKRVRIPHNTREKQRQLAIGHGETLMPNNVIYRTPNSVVTDESGYSSMGVYDTKPARPSSIELRRSYPIDNVDMYSPFTSYSSAAGHNVNGNISQNQSQVQQQMQYDEGAQILYGHANQNTMSSEAIYAAGTPSRTKPRPSQPPPAPPSNESGTGTPNTSNANTPTRGRSMSSSRDALPPPPPIPDNMTSPTLGPMNGSNVAAKLLGRTNSNPRVGSPQLVPNNSVQDANALVMAQLSNQINNFNNNILVQQINMQNVLPPCNTEQHMTKLLQPAPPPPPPPPPVEAQTSNQIMKPMINQGDIQTANTTASHIVGAKKLLPPYQDTRSDLMKAIRDGITLRKVEKSDQKEIEINTALHDVASILARRVAIELSESEDSESEDDSEGWVEGPNDTSA